MCALFGFLDYGKRIPGRTLQKIVQALANASEVRGHHAAGIAYTFDDQLRIFKRPKPAHKLHFRIPNGTAAVMGHTRLTTQGDQKFNQNNHPFRGYANTAFALAHNGILYNDTVLRSKLHLPDTKIETDSYIMVQLIESQGTLSFDSLRYAVEQVKGYYSFTLLDADNHLYFVKGDSPLYLIHFPALGLYLYASTKEIMLNALRHLPVKFPRYDVIAVNDGELLRIAPDGKITRDRFTVQDSYTIYNRNGFSSCLCGWNKTDYGSCSDDEYMVLVELCGYFGVAPEDIRYLRDLGYSYDEIESLLTDPESYGVELSFAEL